MTRKHETSNQASSHSTSPIRIQKFLSGLDYPVGKQDILERARQKGADQDVMEALQKIPEQEYASPISVSREVGKS